MNEAAPARRHAQFARRAACASLLALIALCLAWELWLAPLRPGGSWLALKALPLAAALPGALRGRRYTLQWALLLAPAYLAEGAVRAWTESGLSSRLAALEIALTLAFYAAAIGYVRATRPA